MRRAVLSAALAGAALLACTAVKDDQTTTTLAPSDTTPTSVAGGAATTTTTPAADLGAVSFELDEIAELEQPIALATRGGDAALYVAQQDGVVRRIAITTRRDVDSFAVDRTPVLDISDDVIDDGEQGLLGLTFSTDGNRLYVAYTGTDADQHLDEYAMSSNRATPSSRRELLVIPDFAPNHNGGDLAFGPDGFLYWSMGDGGGAGDPHDSGQDRGDLLGDIIRIDTDVDPDAEGDEPYAIPDGNPFADGGGAPEVWVYGLRNPWRFSFDRATGDLWI